MIVTQINVSFNSNLNDARIVLDTVLATLRNEIPHISEESLLELRLVYNELLANAIVHGNNSDNSKKVELTVKIEDGLVFSSIADEGAGFDYTEWFISKNRDKDVYSEHGRGLVLVNSLTDSIAFNGKGNKINFYKFFNMQESALSIEMETENYSIA